MRLKEHFYLTCIHEILGHRVAVQGTATKRRYYQRRIRELPAVRRRGQQAGGENETFGEECTSIFQLVRAMRRRTKCMITSLHKYEGTTLKTYREIQNYIAASYASAYERMTTEKAV
jgi:hypothetical protein